MSALKSGANVAKELSLILRLAILLESLVLTICESVSERSELSLGIRGQPELPYLPVLFGLSAQKPQFVSQPLPLTQSLSLPSLEVSPISNPIAQPLESALNESSYGCAPLAHYSICSCYDMDNGLLIDCKITAINQIKDVLNSLISQTIKSFTVYFINQTLNSLPERLFQNFSSIEQMYISLPSLVNVSIEALEGLEISLKTLSLFNSKLKAIPKPALSRLKNLSTLSLESNQIQEVEAYAFYGLPLVSLNLQSNQIDSLLEFSFRGLENTLVELILNDNKLERFPLHAFRRLIRLETLKLQSNRISEIPDDGITRFYALKSLDLHSNRFERLDSHSFIATPSLVSLSIANNNLTAISDSSAFEQLLDLESLDLSHNLLEAVQLNGLLALRTLDLSHNHLHEMLFENLDNVKEVFLSNNNISKLTNQTFVNCTRLSVIFLQHNVIQSIDYNSFHSLHHLLTLDLSVNQLKAIDSRLLRYNTKLQSLYLDNNLITDSGLEAEVFQELSSLEKLDLKQNFLTQISDTLFDAIKMHLESVYLSGNPFHCDCRLLSIYEWLESHSRLVVLNDREEMICSKPEMLKDSHVLSLHSIDFCPLPIISQMEITKLESTQVRIRWEVLNDTLVAGFTLEYYLTSERTPPMTQKFLGPFERHSDITGLKSDNWYMVCVEANRKYDRSDSSRPSPYASYHNKNYAEYVSSNRKCSQVRTLSNNESSVISLPTLGIIVSVVVFVVLMITVCVLSTAYKFRAKRIRPLKSQVPEEYITYRHFSLPSSENVYF